MVHENRNHCMKLTALSTLKQEQKQITYFPVFSRTEVGAECGVGIAEGLKEPADKSME